MKKTETGQITFDTRDLMRVASCSHCTTVSILRTFGYAPALEVLQKYIDAPKVETLPQKYGIEFEEQLTRELLATLPAGSLQAPDVGEYAKMEAHAGATIALMEQGVPIIYQGALLCDSDVTQFRGKPDFLVREDWQIEFVAGALTAHQVEGAAGNTKYTAWDAKYASNPKPAYALQVGLYVDALDDVGFKAEHGTHGIILGSRRLEPLMEGEIVPAMRLARQQLDDWVAKAVAMDAAGELGTLMEGLAWHCDAGKYCDICEYPDLCTESRHQVEHLSLIYNIRSNQIEILEAAGITTVSQLAEAQQKPERLNQSIWERVTRQAKLQSQSRASGKPAHEVLPAPKIEMLPPASDGDIFFDMEGFPYFGDRGGLEYLFGNWTRDSGFVDFWAHSRDEEKLAFEAFMDWAIARLEANPSAHIYHYASYELTTLRKLAVRHATREAQVAWLEANNKLVDLLDYVTKSIVVGEESYSIKKLERHYGFKRRSNVTNAADSIDGYDAWLEGVRLSQDPTKSDEVRAEAKAAAADQLQALSDYNEDDVKSTLALYEWLAKMPGATTKFGSNKYSLDSEEEAGLSEYQIRLAKLEARTASLIRVHDEWLEANPNKAGSPESQSWSALTHSILFYAREKAKAFTDLLVQMHADDATLAEDNKATHLLDVREISRGPNSKGTKTNIVFEVRVDPDGTYDVKEKMAGKLRVADPENPKFFCDGDMKQIHGNLVEITAKLPLGTQEWAPDAFFNYPNIGHESKEIAIEELAREITSEWGGPGNAVPTGYAALDLLFRNKPRLANGAALTHGTPDETLANIIRAVDQMQNTVLAIQGPPGSGKTYLGSHTIAHLVARGKKVGVVSNSHAAVENLLNACIDDVDLDPALIYKGRKSDDKEEKRWNYKKATNPDIARALATHSGVVAGGTAWTFSSALFPTSCFDYIFVDEAAQFSMVDSLAVSRATKNLVLLGDPLQLPQVVNAIHPGGVENSSLGHYMGEHAIIPEDTGFFVEVTRRLHPAINAPVSWLAYEGRLQSHPLTEAHLVEGVEPGIHLHPLDHLGNSTQSGEEVAKVLELVEHHLQVLDEDQILVISPYNAQVDALEKALVQAGHQGVRVGTVDRFQGQEADMVIYSFAASSAEDAPRGVEFILDRNRLNVGISRAKSVCHIVFSRHLIKAHYRTLGELKAVSRLVGLLEFAL